jgi:hypothetical protein
VVGAVALLGGAIGAPGALADTGPVPVPVPVAPGQVFAGQVNGVTTGAAIKVDDCPVGPPISAFGAGADDEVVALGHPAPGQTVSAALLGAVSSDTSGFTGSAATSIAVRLGDVSSVSSNAFRITAYGQQVAIPTGISVPCTGTGEVDFVPLPTSGTARTAVVKVAFFDITIQPN